MRKTNQEEIKELIKELQPVLKTKIEKEMLPKYDIKKARDGLIVSFRGEEYKVKYKTIEKYGIKITADEIKRHFSHY